MNEPVFLISEFSLRYLLIFQNQILVLDFNSRLSEEILSDALLRHFWDQNIRLSKIKICFANGKQKWIRYCWAPQEKKLFARHLMNTCHVYAMKCKKMHELKVLANDWWNLKVETNCPMLLNGVYDVHPRRSSVMSKKWMKTLGILTNMSDIQAVGYASGVELNFDVTDVVFCSIWNCYDSQKE